MLFTGGANHVIGGLELSVPPPPLGEGRGAGGEPTASDLVNHPYIMKPISPKAQKDGVQRASRLVNTQRLGESSTCTEQGSCPTFPRLALCTPPSGCSSASFPYSYNKRVHVSKCFSES